MNEKKRVLILCAGNSVRSRMAEGLLRHDGGRGCCKTAREFGKIEGVSDIHDLHVWSLTSRIILVNQVTHRI